MTARIRESRRARGLFALLLFCALAIRVAIPTGFMPVQTGHGLIISICTGQGAVQAMLPVDRKSDDHGHHQTDERPCTFALGLGGPLIDPALPAHVSPMLPVFAAPPVQVIADLVTHRLAAPPPPAQAPPAQA